ncbi:hypothetical protein [Methylobacterium sp. E-066]|uniref:hypothetical protein n=1 Tax=Methylobacterium sp. E-066 TaxID=2836584 RepID=UPI001FBB0FE0|nr:hypothetical protein [Methylobacterium sp. E-066]MCJ2143869.1 hypothetical protein [Methylobacterium sp. E-066]
MAKALHSLWSSASLPQIATDVRLYLRGVSAGNCGVELNAAARQRCPATELWRIRCHALGLDPVVSDTAPTGRKPAPKSGSIFDF